MRLVVLADLEESLVGGDERQFVAIGKIDRALLDAAVVTRNALQLDIEPVSEQVLQRRKPRLGEVGMSFLQRTSDRTARTAGQADQPVRTAFDHRARQMNRLAGRRIEVDAADQPHQIGVAFLRSRNQHDRLQFGTLAAAVALPVGRFARKRQIELAAQDRLNAVLRGLLGEFKRAEQVVGVGDRDGRRLVLLRVADDLAELESALQQRIGRVHPQMDESTVLRFTCLARSSRGCRASQDRVSGGSLAGHGDRIWRVGTHIVGEAGNRVQPKQATITTRCSTPTRMRGMRSSHMHKILSHVHKNMPGSNADAGEET